ncbi:MAG: beta-ketoacyl synthase N-terminal-like domain-containing protein [Pseudomonadota bacterium]
MSERRVFIGGAGAISPIANNVSELIANLLRGDVGLKREIANDQSYVLGRAHYEVAPFKTATNKKLAPRWGTLAIGAAEQALENYPESYRAKKVGGVYMGMGMVPVDVIMKSVSRFQRNNTVSPTTLLSGLPNIAAILIAMEHNLTGPCHAYAMACASALASLHRAYLDVSKGVIDYAVAGGVDSALDAASLASWKAMRVLSNLNENGRACIPFGMGRRGICLAEGAVAFLLGTEHVVPPEERWCEMRGFGESCDAHHFTTPTLEGQILSMNRALKNADLEPQDIDLVIAHGTGTIVGDKTESTAIASVFGGLNADVPVTSNKGMLGHTLGASGGFNICSALTALVSGKVHGTYPTDRVDAQIQSNVILQSTRFPSGFRNILVNSFAFGGINVSAVVSAV